ncbi:MAG: hypothetical protein MZU95_09415 [Desulfomicrobium escambiense]|nr:hypothetical protein [Desulfomicrobium escambiense]
MVKGQPPLVDAVERPAWRALRVPRLAAIGQRRQVRRRRLRPRPTRARPPRQRATT